MAEPKYRIGGQSLYLGDSLAVLRRLPEKSAHCCVTSPPYFGLRSYLKDDHPDKPMEVGQEETPDQFVAKLVAVFAGVRRVLRDDGTCWVNIGDSYGVRPQNRSGEWLGKTGGNTGLNARNARSHEKTGKAGAPDGSLMGIPWKFAEAMRADGWLLRAEMTWVKLSSMPESISGWRWERCRKKLAVGKYEKEEKQGETRLGAGFNQRWEGKDGYSPKYEDCPGCKKCKPHGGYVLHKGSWRPTRATESIFLFAKSDRYYADGEAVKQLARASTVMRDRYTRVLDDPDEQFAAKHDHETQSGGTANLRNWVVFKGEMLKEKHYAAFPSGIPMLAIRAGTSQKGVCQHCGAPWARVVIVEGKTAREKANDRGWCNKAEGKGLPNQGLDYAGGHEDNIRDVRTTGWRPTCKCPAHDPVPATVLEPFMGSGTTLAACERANRKGIGIDLSEEYLEIGVRRVRKAAARKGFGLA